MRNSQTLSVQGCPKPYLQWHGLVALHRSSPSGSWEANLQPNSKKPSETEWSLGTLGEIQISDPKPVQDSAEIGSWCLVSRHQPNRCDWLPHSWRSDRQLSGRSWSSPVRNHPAMKNMPRVKPCKTWSKLKKYGTIPHAVYGVTPGAIPSYAVHPGALHAYRILGPGDQDLVPTNIIDRGTRTSKMLFRQKIGTKKIDGKWHIYKDPIKIHNVLFPWASQVKQQPQKRCAAFQGPPQERIRECFLESWAKNDLPQSEQ